MKKLIMAAMIAGSVAGFGMATAQLAAARDAFMFSFNTGDVAVGYSDGYWDTGHRWRNAREAREYRARYRDRY